MVTRSGFGVEDVLPQSIFIRQDFSILEDRSLVDDVERMLGVRRGSILACRIETGERHAQQVPCRIHESFRFGHCSTFLTRRRRAGRTRRRLGYRAVETRSSPGADTFSLAAWTCVSATRNSHRASGFPRPWPVPFGSAILSRPRWRRQGGVVSVFAEYAFAAPSPKRQGLLALFAPQCRGDFDERAENHRAIVIDQLNEPGLCD